MNTSRMAKTAYSSIIGAPTGRISIFKPLNASVKMRASGLSAATSDGAKRFQIWSPTSSMAAAAARRRETPNGQATPLNAANAERVEFDHLKAISLYQKDVYAYIFHVATYVRPPSLHMILKSDGLKNKIKAALCRMPILMTMFSIFRRIFFNR